MVKKSEKERVTATESDSAVILALCQEKLRAQRASKEQSIGTESIRFPERLHHLSLHHPEALAPRRPSPGFSLGQLQTVVF